MICENCKTDYPLDRFNLECNAPTWCFRCRASGLSVAFAGGKQYFHDETDAARQRVAIGEARAAGFDPIPAETGKAFNAASGAMLKKIGDVSKKAGAFGGKPTVPAPSTGTPKVGAV